MTEQEWLLASHTQPMLGFLRDKASDRKLRLFAVACCRRVWEFLDAENRRMVEGVEQLADGLMEPQSLEGLRKAAIERLEKMTTPWFPGRHRMVIEMLLLNTFGAGTVAENNDSLRRRGLDPHEARSRFAASWPTEAAVNAASHVWPELYWLGKGYGATETGIATARIRAGVPPSEAEGVHEWFDKQNPEFREQSLVLHDLFGNPFRPAAIDPTWLTWHGGLLVSMAHRMYESRDFSDMPVLADGLEEAGCQDQDILGHCRSGEHVRGCWVVDLLLSKE
jgi:hypothetical protein